MWRNIRYDWPLHFVLLFTNWLPDNVIFIRFRGWLAHFFFGECGSRLRLGRSITFYNPSKLRMGSDIQIAHGNWFSAGGEIIIDDEVAIGPKCIFASSNHVKENGTFHTNKADLKKIVIRKGVWIGGNCAITAGVEIGNGSLIGANTVVTKNVPNDVMFAGNPGKIIKEI